MPLTTVQIFGLSLNLVGALVIALSEIFSRDKISRIAGTYVDGNPHFEKYLKERNLFLILGSVLMIAGFALQLVGEISG